jgi:hypothetical protein
MTVVGEDSRRGKTTCRDDVDRAAVMTAPAENKGTAKAKARGTAGAAGATAKARPEARAEQQQTVADVHRRRLKQERAAKDDRHNAVMRRHYGALGNYGAFGKYPGAHPAYAKARALNRIRSSSSSNRSRDGDLSSSSSRSSSRAAAVLARERRREAVAAAAVAEPLDGVWVPTPQQTPNRKHMRPKSPQQAPRAKVQPDLVQPESQSQQDSLHLVLYSSSNSIV